MSSFFFSIGFLFICALPCGLLAMDAQNEDSDMCSGVDEDFAPRADCGAMSTGSSSAETAYQGTAPIGWQSFASTSNLLHICAHTGSSNQSQQSGSDPINFDQWSTEDLLALLDDQIYEKQEASAIWKLQGAIEQQVPNLAIQTDQQRLCLFMAYHAIFVSCRMDHSISGLELKGHYHALDSSHYAARNGQAPMYSKIQNQFENKWKIAKQKLVGHQHVMKLQNKLGNLHSLAFLGAEGCQYFINAYTGAVKEFPRTNFGPDLLSLVRQALGSDKKSHWSKHFQKLVPSVRQ